ncbi:MAG: TetR/AcrR family transcriptional regulator [Spirochaetaceae bacterium]|jgi:AcrR family transcriptional regulator|nr:TetR/AcrR family transcriptional regulator [Spirochaetaceae bacterium]
MVKKAAQAGRKAKLSRSQIRDNAVKLICTMKYEEVTVDLICRSLTISRSTFYNHFKNIDELVTEYCSIREYPQPDQSIWILSAPTAYERLMRGHLSYVIESDKPGRLIIYGIYLKICLTKQDLKDLAIIKRMKKLLLPLIRQAQERGEIQNNSAPKDLCETAVSVEVGTFLLWCISGGAFDRKKTIIKELETLYNPRRDLRLLPQRHTAPAKTRARRHR